MLIWPLLDFRVDSDTLYKWIFLLLDLILIPTQHSKQKVNNFWKIEILSNFGKIEWPSRNIWKFKNIHGDYPPGFEDVKKFHCEYCPEVFLWGPNLKHHIQLKHSNGGLDEFNIWFSASTFTTLATDQKWTLSRFCNSYPDYVKYCGKF